MHIEYPSTGLIDQESNHLILSFCTFCTLLKGTKLSYQNIFILVLQDTRLRAILKDLMSVETDHEIVRLLIEFDPTIAKSKYITKYLNTIRIGTSR